MAASPGPRELVDLFGGHPSQVLGLELALGGDQDRWLLAACLLSQRGGEARALEGFRVLMARDLSAPERVAEAPEQLAPALDAAGWCDPEVPALLLARAARGLCGSGGSEQLAREAEGLEELGGRLAGLAPGFGRAAVARFLRPLRDHWPAAAEIPLSRAARAAALHLGWIADGEDEEGEPGALRARLRGEPDAPALADVEAALERLGSAACLRGATRRCPLRARCPARAVPNAAG